jgi:hypothetical protein
MHRLDLCTLTAESAWRKYVELQNAGDRLGAVLALTTHFERVEERARAKRLVGFGVCHGLDHTARGKRR